MNVLHKMKSLRIVILCLTVATHAVRGNSYLEEEMLRKLTRMASEVDMDAVKDLLTDAIADEIKTEIFKEAASLASSSDENKEERPKFPDKSRSESRLEGSWLDLDSEPSSVFEDPDENDALYNSRDISPNPGKRDEYYESLEKKSQRSTYVSPPRKNFFSSTPEEILDSSSSEEHYHHEERRPDYRGPPPLAPRMMGHPADYYRPGVDVIHSESHPFLESLHFLPSHAMHQEAAMQTPPWRYTQGQSYPRKQAPPIPPPQARPMPEEQTKSSPPLPPVPQRKQQERIPEPLIIKSTMHKKRGPYKKASTSARRPAPPSVPLHMAKIHPHSHDDFKFKSSMPRSKPSWTPDYKIKEPISSIHVDHDDSAPFIAPPSLGNPLRQQFHEQGTRGPHSYKFGYSTGDRDNPMARYEERDADGMVRGSYSYVDARGQKQVVRYESHPKLGFKARTSNAGY